jgi:hypothetical protein
LSFNSKLNQFDKNLNLDLNLNHSKPGRNRYAEARRHLDVAPQISGETFPQRILPNARTFINVHILVSEEEIIHDIQEQ